MGSCSHAARRRLSDPIANLKKAAGMRHPRPIAERHPPIGEASTTGLVSAWRQISLGAQRCPSRKSRRVKGAAVAAHLEVPAGIILPAKFTVTTHIGSGQSRFLRRCVGVLGVRRLRRLVSAYRRPSSCRKPTSMRSLSSAAAMRPAQRASRTHPNRVLLIRTPALPTQPRTAPRRSFGVVSLAFADWEADRRPTV